MKNLKYYNIKDCLIIPEFNSAKNTVQRYFF
nr:MAG TPA: hypothetical protein [Caudoviricetes sp.]